MHANSDKAYPTCTIIQAWLWSAVIDVDITSVSLPPSNTRASEASQTILKAVIRHVYIVYITTCDIWIAGLLLYYVVHALLLLYCSHCMFLCFDKG